MAQLHWLIHCRGDHLHVYSLNAESKQLQPTYDEIWISGRDGIHKAVGGMVVINPNTVRVLDEARWVSVSSDVHGYSCHCRLRVDNSIVFDNHVELKNIELTSL